MGLSVLESGIIGQLHRIATVAAIATRQRKNDYEEPYTEIIVSSKKGTTVTIGLVQEMDGIYLSWLAGDKPGVEIVGSEAQAMTTIKALLAQEGK